MRWVVGDRAITGSAASASQIGRFETKCDRPATLLERERSLSAALVTRVEALYTELFTINAEVAP